MTMPITLSEKDWLKLRARLTQDNSRSVMLIREKMKAVLGFTVRKHTHWTDDLVPEESIRLDFYNEPKRTMFILKYSEYLGKSGKTSLD
jgi:hypothetical protein